MADDLAFNQGKDAIAEGGVTATIYQALSTKKVGTQAAGEHQVGDTYVGGFGEVAWTGYARKAIVRGSFANGILTVAAQSWNTGTATDGPASAKSFLLLDSNNKILAARNIVAGGTGFDLSKANTGLDIPAGSFFLQNVGGG